MQKHSRCTSVVQAREHSPAATDGAACCGRVAQRAGDIRAAPGIRATVRAPVVGAPASPFAWLSAKTLCAPQSIGRGRHDLSTRSSNPSRITVGAACSASLNRVPLPVLLHALLDQPASQALSRLMPGRHLTSRGPGGPPVPNGCDPSSSRFRRFSWSFYQ